MDKILTTKMDEILSKQCANVNERYKNFGSACLVDDQIRIYLKKEICILFGQNVIDYINSKAILHHIARWCVLGIVGGGLSEDEVLKFYAQKDFDNMFSDTRKITMFKASLASPFNLPTAARQRDQPDFDKQGSFYRQLTSIVKCLSNMHRAAKEQINSHKRRKKQDDDDDNDLKDAKEVERNVALTLEHTPVRRSGRNRNDNHIAYTDFPPKKRLKKQKSVGHSKKVPHFYFSYSFTVSF